MPLISGYLLRYGLLAAGGALLAWMWLSALHDAELAGERALRADDQRIAEQARAQSLASRLEQEQQLRAAFERATADAERARRAVVAQREALRQQLERQAAADPSLRAWMDESVPEAVR